jgi:glucose/mannose-6-phosphate isomerase
MELTEQLIAPGATATFRIESRGQTTVERVFSLVLLGDLVSLYLAVLRGVDPTPGPRSTPTRTLTRLW